MKVIALLLVGATVAAAFAPAGELDFCNLATRLPVEDLVSM